jgi:hypothetical protein
VIALDAFSADAIPIHMLTRDALEMYLDKLQPHGVITFHISNRYLDLEPQVGKIAEATGLACYAQYDSAITKRTFGKSPSQWVALARAPGDLGHIVPDPRWRPCKVADSRAWTDDYANIVGAIRWR